jgi:hypothetical protein
MKMTNRRAYKELMTLHEVVWVFEGWIPIRTTRTRWRDLVLRPCGDARRPHRL